MFTTRRRKRSAPAQDALLEFIIDYKRANDGLLPSYDEMGTGLGVSTQCAYSTALRLVGHGILRFNTNRKLVLGGTYLPPDNL